MTQRPDIHAPVIKDQSLTETGATQRFTRMEPYRMNMKGHWIIVLDKIWDRKSFEVGGHLAVVAGMKKQNDHEEPTKVDS